jgi:hypothetical protein
MKCYPLGIAGLLAIACDCMRRGDLEGAQAALARASALAREDGPARPDAAGGGRARGVAEAR